MAAGRRGRNIGAIAVSAAVHAIILAVVALHAPLLREPEEPAGRPEPIIPVVLMPRTPPAASQKPTVVRLHRRPQRFAPTPIAPLPVPPAPTSRGAKPGPVVVIHPAPLPEGPKGEIRATLRAGPPGCANQDAVGLTREEREHCNEVFGKGAKTAPFLGIGVDPGKLNAFDRAAAKKAGERHFDDPAPPIGAEMRARQPNETPSEAVTPRPLPR